MSEGLSTKQLVTRLVALVVVMFCFGVFVLPPFYDVLCRALGINGKTASGTYGGSISQVDEQRDVRVQFISSNAEGMSWSFAPQSHELTLHPGQTKSMIFIALSSVGLHMLITCCLTKFMRALSLLAKS